MTHFASSASSFFFSLAVSLGQTKFVTCNMKHVIQSKWRRSSVIDLIRTYWKKMSKSWKGSKDNRKWWLYNWEPINWVHFQPGICNEDRSLEHHSPSSLEFLDHKVNIGIYFKRNVYPIDVEQKVSPHMKYVHYTRRNNEDQHNRAQHNRAQSKHKWGPIRKKGVYAWRTPVLQK